MVTQTYPICVIKYETEVLQDWNDFFKKDVSTAIAESVIVTQITLVLHRDCFWKLWLMNLGCLERNITSMLFLVAGIESLVTVGVVSWMFPTYGQCTLVLQTSD